MEAATEKYLGIKVRIKIDNALSYPASTAKTLTEIKAGAPPTIDLMYQSELSGAPLYKDRALELKYRNLSSAWRPNTPAAEFVAKYKVIKVDVDFMLKEGGVLSKKISDILLKKK